MKVQMALKGVSFWQATWGAPCCVCTCVSCALPLCQMRKRSQIQPSTNPRLAGVMRVGERYRCNATNRSRQWACMRRSSYVSMSQHKEHSAQRASRPNHSRFMSDVGAPKQNAPHKRICML